MLANVLNSPISVQASIQVVRAFVKLRQILSTHKELAHKLIELERKIENHDEKDTSLNIVVQKKMNIWVGSIIEN